MQSYQNLPNLKILREKIQKHLKISLDNPTVFFAQNLESKSDEVSSRNKQKLDANTAAIKIQKFMSKALVARYLIRSPQESRTAIHTLQNQILAEEKTSNKQKSFDKFMFGYTVAGHYDFSDQTYKVKDIAHSQALYNPCINFISTSYFTSRGVSSSFINYFRNNSVIPNIANLLYNCENIKNPSMPHLDSELFHCFPLSKLKNINVEEIFREFMARSISKMDLYYRKAGFSLGNPWTIERANEAIKFISCGSTLNFILLSKFVQIGKFNHSTEHFIKDITTICSKAAINPTAWEVATTLEVATTFSPLSKFMAEIPTSLDVPTKLTANFGKLVNNNLTPLSFCNPKMLCESQIMFDLKAIANGKHSTQLLAACLIRLLQGLPDTMNPNSIQRIYLFVDIAVKFYQKNYERFSYMVYSIVHEITIALYDLMQLRKLDNNYYVNFKKEINDNAITAFGIHPESTAQGNFTLIAAPAISGLNAFITALSLAKKMKVVSSSPIVKNINAQYFEFDNFYEKSNESSGGDIYLLTCGPIMDTNVKDEVLPPEQPISAFSLTRPTYSRRVYDENPGGVNPGVDINQFIRQKILKNNTVSKPVTLVIDTTTALYSNLKLDSDILAQIYNGNISLIVHESHQKFGLLHTDQAQYGRVYGICSKISYASKDLIDFELHAEVDLTNHLDMLIGSFISVHCGTLLEKIKVKHFNNGFLIKEFISEELNEPKQILGECLSHSTQNYFVTHCVNSNKY